jgi:histidyl-tRNA synthetase
LDRLSELVELLSCYPGLVENLVLDFGMAQGIAYYNGITFQVSHPDAKGSLGGGGRYDDLARALGSPDTVPALGFAYNLDLVADLAKVEVDSGRLETANLLRWPSSALVISKDHLNPNSVLAAARELRRSGLQVELAMSEQTLSSALSYASASGINQVVVVSQDGQRQVHQISSSP